jgi:small subunit ribosomal protein S2
MSSIDKMATDGTFETLSKRERLQIERQRAKLEKNLGSISDLTRLPAAMFIVDVHKEYIAVREANRLNIPVFAMVDTNSDPRPIDFPIPSNDDASKSISLIIDYVCEAVAEGLGERKMEKEKDDKNAKVAKEAKAAKDKDAKAVKDKDAKAKRERIKEQPKAEQVKKADEKPAEAKAEKDAEPKAEKAAEPVAEKTAEAKADEPVAEKAAEPVAEKAAEVKAEEPKAEKATEVEAEEPKAAAQEEKTDK